MPAKVTPHEALRLLPDDYRMGEAESVNDSRTPEQIAEDEAARMQAKTEGVTLPPERAIEFMGRKFRIEDKIGLMPLMEFAYFADSGADTADMGALVAIYEMLKDCIHKDNWDEFRAHAKHKRAEAEDLLPVVKSTIELLTARPTAQGTDSSAPSREMSDTSMDTSSGQRAGLVSVDKLASSL